MKIFNLIEGSLNKYVDSQGNEYDLQASVFERHNHNKYPLYYLNYPLDAGIRAANEGKLVATIECSTDNLPSPYSAAIEGSWIVGRPHVDIKFQLKKLGDKSWLECVIEEHESLVA